MFISVLIPTIRGNTLDTAVNAVLRQTHAELELVVMAQGRDRALHAAVERAERIDGRVRVLRLDRLGASLARNAGLRAARGEIIAMTDDDCEPAPDWLSVIDRCFATEPETGVVGGALVAPRPARYGPHTCPTNTPSESLYDPVRSGRRAPVGWDWLAANVAIRRTIADLVGPFDENLGPGTPFPASEDFDWKIRLEALGVKMRATPRSVVRHTHGIRYGLRAILRHLRSYALGQGGFAGKRSLMGDARGADLRHAAQKKARTPSRSLPADALRWQAFRSAFELCLRRYRVAEGGHLLEQRG